MCPTISMKHTTRQIIKKMKIFSLEFRKKSKLDLLIRVVLLLFGHGLCWRRRLRNDLPAKLLELITCAFSNGSGSMKEKKMKQNTKIMSIINQESQKQVCSGSIPPFGPTTRPFQRCFSRTWISISDQI